MKVGPEFFLGLAQLAIQGYFNWKESQKQAGELTPEEEAKLDAELQAIITNPPPHWRKSTDLPPIP